MVNVAVLGYGTVGSGVVEVIETNKALVNKRSGQELHVKYILDLREFPGDPYEDRIVHDVSVIMADPEVAIVCEAMGGIGKAYEFTRMALERGKSVCTSNKELVAKFGPELLELARENKCSYLFEASVGGGIPVLRTITEALTAEKITGIKGIVNGTTNYILSKMEKEGADFADVLKEAQRLGYAEQNPAADIEGHDACRKLAILASLSTGRHVDCEKIHTEGITGVSAADFVYAKALGCTVKLFALGQVAEDGKVLAMVAPFLVGSDHPMAMVNDVFNAVFITSNMLGDSMYYGRGAGKLPTASAVVGDVVECAKTLGETIPCFWDKEEVELADVREQSWKYYVRLSADACEAAKEAFPEAQFLTAPGREEDFACLTREMKEKDFAAVCEKLSEKVLSVLRMA